MQVLWTYLWLHIQSLVDVVCVLVWCVHARLAHKQHQQEIVYAATNTFTILAQYIITTNRLYSITKQRQNNILINYNQIILWNFNFNNFVYKNLCNLARHKYKTPWGWHRDVEICRSVHYWKRYCCDIHLCVGLWK